MFVWSLSFLISLAACTGKRESSYDRAVRLYNAESWQSAIDAFHAALVEYESWKEVVVTCYKTCGNEPWTLSEQDGENIEVEPKTIASLLEMSECASECCGSRSGVASHRVDFESRMPYHYLQMCYYQIGDLKKAVQAAHTYLEANHGDKVMDRNLMFYESSDGYSPDFAVSMEPNHYLSLYLKGVDEYEKKNYMECASLFEAALQAYYHAVEVCQARCQIVPPEKSRSKKRLSLIGTVSRSLNDLLHCRLNCSGGGVGYTTRLTDRKGYERMHYHYLQFCYFKLDSVHDALATALVYIELKPDDQIMQNNIEFYQSKIPTEKTVKPRKEIEHIRKRRLEEQLIKKTPGTELPSDEEPLGPSSDLSSAERQSSTPKKRRERDDSYYASPHNWTIDYDEASTGKRILDNDVILLPPPGQEDLERVVAEGLLTDDDCKRLIALAEAGAQPGDGYGANAHPHTTHEKFEGLNILDAAQSARDGRLDRASSRLYYDSAEKSRALVEKYFQLNGTLYLTYTHLVCRTALEAGRGDERDADELSHPVHSDNCIIRDGGRECAKVAPAYTWRDYSAILYLNSDFVGGNFFWAHTNLTIETMVRPKCGRLVGFDGGYYHGVTGISSGKRCAVALWFTLDEKHEETASRLAREIFAELDVKEEFSRTMRTRTEF